MNTRPQGSSVDVPDWHDAYAMERRQASRAAPSNCIRPAVTEASDMSDVNSQEAWTRYVHCSRGACEEIPNEDNCSESPRVEPQQDSRC
jgi:hypothetical protein